MSPPSVVERDERTVAVENAGYKWACHFLVFALLIDFFYRYYRHEIAWDLLGLAFMAGVVCTVYQARQKALPHGWVKTAALFACVGAVIGVITTWILIWLRS